MFGDRPKTRIVRVYGDVNGSRTIRQPAGRGLGFPALLPRRNCSANSIGTALRLVHRSIFPALASSLNIPFTLSFAIRTGSGLLMKFRLSLMMFLVSFGSAVRANLWLRRWGSACRLISNGTCSAPSTSRLSCRSSARAVRRPLRGGKILGLQPSRGRTQSVDCFSSEGLVHRLAVRRLSDCFGLFDPHARIDLYVPTISITN